MCWEILLNHNPSHKFVAAMTEYAAYLDASGHPNDQPFVVVAGFIATESQWLAFEKPWKDALQRHGLGDVFHMTDFEAQGRKDRGIVLDDLIDIINHHTASHFSCAVEMSAYRKINDAYILEEAIGTPYSIAARGIARNINLWKEKCFRKDDHLLIFIEEGTKHHGDMEEAFRRDLLPIPQKVPKDHPSVQPADLLSWEVHNYSRHQNRRRSLMKLISNGDPMPEAHGKFGEKNMLFSCKQINVPLRKDVPSSVQIVYKTSPKRPRRRTIK